MPSPGFASLNSATESATRSPPPATRQTGTRGARTIFATQRASFPLPKWKSAMVQHPTIGDLFPDSLTTMSTSGYGALLSIRLCAVGLSSTFPVILLCELSSFGSPHTPLSKHPMARCGILPSGTHRNRTRSPAILAPTRTSTTSEPTASCTSITTIFRRVGVRGRATGGALPPIKRYSRYSRYSQLTPIHFSQIRNVGPDRAVHAKLKQ